VANLVIAKQDCDTLAPPSVPQIKSAVKFTFWSPNLVCWVPCSGSCQTS
jgi:hypothetical protein